MMPLNGDVRYNKPVSFERTHEDQRDNVHDATVTNEYNARHEGAKSILTSSKDLSWVPISASNVMHISIEAHQCSLCRE